MRQALLDLVLEMRESVWLMATKEGRGWADRIEALAKGWPRYRTGEEPAPRRCPTCGGWRSRECSGRHLQDWHPNHSGCNDLFHAEPEVGHRAGCDCDWSGTDDCECTLAERVTLLEGLLDQADAVILEIIGTIWGTDTEPGRKLIGSYERRLGRKLGIDRALSEEGQQ